MQGHLWSAPNLSRLLSCYPSCSYRLLAAPSDCALLCLTCMFYTCLVLLLRKPWLHFIFQPGFLSFFKTPIRAHLVQEAFAACFQSGLGAPSSSSFSVLCTSFSAITDGPLLCWFILFTSLKPELCKDRDHVFCSVHPNT